jgi:hypothetical protein
MTAFHKQIIQSTVMISIDMPMTFCIPYETDQAVFDQLNDGIGSLDYHSNHKILENLPVNES